MQNMSFQRRQSVSHLRSIPHPMCWILGAPPPWLYTYRQPMPKSCKEVSAGLQMQDSSSKELELCSWGCMTMEKKTGALRALSMSPKWKWPVCNHIIWSRVSWTSRRFLFQLLLFSHFFFLYAVPLALPSVQHFSKSLLFLFFQTTWAIYRLCYCNLINNWMTSWIWSYAEVPSPLPLFFAGLYTLAICSVLCRLGDEPRLPWQRQHQLKTRLDELM